MNKTVKVSCILHALLALALCFVPLFNLLSYEFSLAIGLLAVCTGFSIGLSKPATSPFSLRAQTRAVGYSCLQLVLPLLIIGLNAFRVRNCDFMMGLGFFAALPLVSAILSSVLGLLAQDLFEPRRWFTRLATALIFLGFPLLSIFWDLYFEAPISIFSHVWGYSPGTLYDEAVSVNWDLLSWRGMSLAGAFGCIGLLYLFTKYNPHRNLKLLSTVLAIFAFIGLDQMVGSLSLYRVDREVLQKELSVTRSGPGLIIHLPKDINSKLADKILLDHQFQLARLREKLKLDELPTIHSYVYKNAAIKGKLLGGHNTMFAKPWLGEIHIHGLQTPHDILAHELVHAVAATFCDSFLNVPGRAGVIPNMGLVEGFAEAFTAPRGKLGLHAFARSMRDLKLAPKMQQLLGAGGFWRQAPARAYTIAGSFVRYLLEQYGAEPLKQLYAKGEFRGAFGKDLDTLVDEWNRFLDTVVVKETGRRTARAAFNKPAIFERPCAHVIADLKKQVRKSNAKDALNLRQKICDFEGNTPAARLALALAYKRAGNTETFLQISNELLEENTLRPYQKNKLYEQLGNFYWRDGKLEKAKTAFQNALDLGVDLNSRRAQWIKLDALSRPPEQSENLRRYLSREMKADEATNWLANQAEQFPENPSITYLYGRNLYLRRQFEGAITQLAQNPTHPFDVIEAETHRVAADSAWHLNHFEDATRHYQTYRELAPNSGEFERAVEWLARIQWMLEHNNQKAPSP